MRIGIMYEQGDIVLIPVPFTDLSSQRRRPVIVISNSTYNQKTTDIVVVAMTSNPVEVAQQSKFLMSILSLKLKKDTQTISQPTSHLANPKKYQNYFQDSSRVKTNKTLHQNSWHNYN